MSNRPPCHPTFALAKREESIYGLQPDNIPITAPPNFEHELPKVDRRPANIGRLAQCLPFADGDQRLSVDWRSVGRVGCGSLMETSRLFRV